MKTTFLLTCLVFSACFNLEAANSEIQKASPAKENGKQVSKDVMDEIYNEVKTPYKYGVILKGENGKWIDCPNIFRHDDKWYMMYICMNEVGYETHLARSENLLDWKPMGKILSFPEAGWDKWQADGGVALMDHLWGGTCQLQQFNGKYWLSYIGGSLQGYETDPLSIGIAWTENLTKPAEWARIPENPVLSSDQPAARDFERKTLYKSNIIWDKSESLGFPFVMFYNAKAGDGCERIGMALSRDMKTWQRFGAKAVIDNGTGISGDPQIVKIDDVWVMFYFGAFWKPKAFDTFACSYDLVNWTKWQGPDLIEPSEPWDKTYAHKPWVIKHNGIVYHYYCAVGDQGRVIALATSKDMKKEPVVSFKQKCQKKEHKMAIKDYLYKPVPFTEVTFTATFWRPRIETNRTVTIPFAFDQCEKTHRIEDFKVAGGLSKSPWQGRQGFDDSDVYKVIEGASYCLTVKPDKKLDSYLDQIISYIAAAQEDNGYLYTLWTTRTVIKKPMFAQYINQPWDNLPNSHELYNVGHLYEAAVAHFQATGKHSLLDVAIKSANLVCEVFGPGKNEGIPGHQEIEIGLVKLYRITGDDKYLQQAKWFLDRRGRGQVNAGSQYRQEHKPVVEQTEAVGHAVRANYMYSAMADVAALTGEAAYIKAIDTIWQNVVDSKLYITGGVGAVIEQEKYGKNYELPNATAYCETCATIANVYWNHRMFLLHGDAMYIDVMERVLYNGLLSGVSLDGKNFFYRNPLETEQGRDRQPWFGCACCPVNMTRFLASVSGYAYALRDRQVYVNLFAESSAELQIENQQLQITQKTNYPWDGKILITVEPDEPLELSIMIRIPGWAVDEVVPSDLYKFYKPCKEKTLIHVNGKPIDFKPVNGYAKIERLWKNGDTIEVHLPMPIRRVLCNEKVRDNLGKTVLQRGPIVYCLEWPDVEDGNVLEMVLEKDTKLHSEFDPNLLGGVTVIKGTSSAKESRNFRAIPYYVWANRGKGQMTTWIRYK